MKVLTKAIKIQMNQKVMSQKMKNKIKKTLQQSVLLLLLKGNSVDKYLRQNYLLLLIVGQVIKLLLILLIQLLLVQQALIQIQLIQNTTNKNTNLLYRLNLYLILFNFP